MKRLIVFVLLGGLTACLSEPANMGGSEAAFDEALASPEEALAFYQNAVAEYPDHGLYQYKYGYFLLDADRYEEAIPQLEAVIQAQPNHADALFALSVAHHNQLLARHQHLDREDAPAVAAFKEEIRATYTKILPYLEQARQLNEASGQSNQPVCQMLFLAYTNTDQIDKAEEAHACADPT